MSIKKTARWAQMEKQDMDRRREQGEKVWRRHTEGLKFRAKKGGEREGNGSERTDWGPLSSTLNAR